eukprot:777390-Prymnesium_polylepis.1
MSTTHKRPSHEVDERTEASTHGWGLCTCGCKCGCGWACHTYGCAVHCRCGYGCRICGVRSQHLARDHVRVVEGVDERAPLALDEPHRLRLRLVVVGAVQPHCRSAGLGRVE